MSLKVSVIIIQVYFNIIIPTPPSCQFYLSLMITKKKNILITSWEF